MQPIYFKSDRLLGGGWAHIGVIHALAVRASIALPGLFTPVQRDGSWLVDGGLVNPVPVSLCRAMGADIVIAVDLNTGLLVRHLKSMRAPASNKRAAAEDATLTDSVMARIQTRLTQLGLNQGNGTKTPAMLDVMASSINIILETAVGRARWHA